MRRLLLVSFVFLVSCSKPVLQTIPFPIWNETKAELTREYNIIHYGLDSYILKNPQIIVIHYTAINDLTNSLLCFLSNTLPPERKYLGKFSTLNVGVHFLVDKDGTVYSLLPEKVIGRHTIGLNYTSFGIENVGGSSHDLTAAQLTADAQIVHYLTSKYPSIKYLIGHHEYTNTQMPHYKLYLEKDKKYKPTYKIDPGIKFMKDLKELLSREYHLSFGTNGGKI